MLSGRTSVRICVVRPPQPIDEVDLSVYKPGCVYDIEPLVAALLVCEGWAFPLPPVPSTPAKPPFLPPLRPIYRK